MDDKVYKLVEIVGTSASSIEAAIENGIKKARKSLRNLGWVQVNEIRGLVGNDGIAQYQVVMKVGFRIEDSDPRQATRSKPGKKRSARQN